MQSQGVTGGAAAPTFTLRTLLGAYTSLEALLRSERPLLLVFADPGCAASKRVLPRITNWQRGLARGLNIVLISRGSIQDNLAAAVAHGLPDLPLQTDREAAAAFGVVNTPTVVLISAGGRIASAPRTGTEAISDLVTRITLRHPILQCVTGS